LAKTVSLRTKEPKYCQPWWSYSTALLNTRVVPSRQQANTQELSLLIWVAADYDQRKLHAATATQPIAARQAVCLPVCRNWFQRRLYRPNK